jgi:glycosyltransferase involved in cell wall biosynthesis
MLLSVIIPVYNERHTLGTVLTAVAQTLPNVSKEVVIVDDCSKDGTREWLKTNFPGRAAQRIECRSRWEWQPCFYPNVRAFEYHHPSNLSRV